MRVEAYPEKYWPIFEEYEVTADEYIRPVPSASYKLVNPTEWEGFTTGQLQILGITGDILPELKIYSPVTSRESYDAVRSAIETRSGLGRNNPHMAPTAPKFKSANLDPVLKWISILGLPFTETAQPNNALDMIESHRSGIRIMSLLGIISRLHVIVDIKDLLRTANKRSTLKESQCALASLKQYHFFKDTESCNVLVNQLIAEAMTNVKLLPHPDGKKITLGQLTPIEIFYLSVAEGDHPPARCHVCNDWYQPKKTNDLYCTRDCYKKAERSRNRPIAEARRLHAKGIPLEEIASRTGLTLKDINDALTIKRTLGKNH